MVLSLFAKATASVQSPVVFDGPDFQIVKVADGVYAAIAKSGGLASGNAGFVIGNDGVLVFDTFYTPAAIEELIALTRLDPTTIAAVVGHKRQGETFGTYSRGPSMESSSGRWGL